MSVLIKVFGIGIICILAVGLLGCRPNLYTDTSDAEHLRYIGKYREALVKYEQALKKFSQFPVDTQVVNVSFPTLLKYGIAFCYAKLAETEGNVSLYIKAETAAKESYETAIVRSDQADTLYLWGYILFKQARYEEAREKFEVLIGTPLPNDYRGDFTADVLYVLGKVYLGLDDEPAARRVFTQLENRIETAEQRVPVNVQRLEFLAVHYEILVALGQVYLELGDASAARRVFAQLENRIETALQSEWLYVNAKIVIALGKMYLELGDASAARRVFTQLLEHFPDSSQIAEVERLLQTQ